SWNTAAYIERCLTSLDTQTGVSVETMVIDNGSNDASLVVLRRLGVRHVALPHNIGFAAAVNMGAARTGAPFVLVLNADCFLAPDCLRLLAAAMAAVPGLGGAQSLILQEESGSDVTRIYSTG